MNGSSGNNTLAVLPDPLIAECGDAIIRLGGLIAPGRTTTLSHSLSEAMTALQYLARGPAERNQRLADEHFDRLFARAGNSSTGRAKPRLWSSTPTSRVYTYDTPFGELDQHLSAAFDFSLIFKEYLRSGMPDHARVVRNAELYKSIYYNSRVRAEVSVRTERRLVCKRTGQNLAYECLSKALAPEVEEESRSLLEYLVGVPSLTSTAIADDYGGKFSRSALALHPFLPRQARYRYANAVRRDACMLGARMGAPLFPHIDPTSTNLVYDGGVRFIDLEKATELLVTADHLFAHVWFDPAYDLSFDERCGHVAALEGPWYYLLRRVSRAFEGRSRAPLPEWSAGAQRRFSLNLENLRNLNLSLAPRYETASMLLDLDDAQMRAKLEMEYHRCP